MASGAVAKLVRKGLDMSRKARMERAREMGFDTRAFHGTNQDIEAFSHQFSGDATQNPFTTDGLIWLSQSPDHAAQYAELAARQTRRNKRELDAARPIFERDMAAAERRGDWGAVERIQDQWEQMEFGPDTQGGQNVIPARIRMSNPYIHDASVSDLDLGEAVRAAREGGHDGLVWRNSTDTPLGGLPPGDHYAVFDPAQIRSEFAAFDPAQRESSNLLAGVGGAAVGAGMLAAPNTADASVGGSEQSEPAYDPVMARGVNAQRRAVDAEVGRRLAEFEASAAAPRPDEPLHPALAVLAQAARNATTRGIPLYEQPLASTADTLDRLAYGDYRRGREGLGTLAADAVFTAMEVFDPVTWAALGREQQQQALNALSDRWRSRRSNKPSPYKSLLQQ